MEIILKPPSTLPGNAHQEPGRGVVIKPVTMFNPHALNDDHDDPCFRCRGNCENCDYNIQEDLFETLAEILEPEPITPQ